MKEKYVLHLRSISLIVQHLFLVLGVDISPAATRAGRFEGQRKTTFGK